jgi:hypothetical protein
MIRVSSVLGLDVVDNSATPPAGQLAVYAKDDRLHAKDDQGNERAYAGLDDLVVLTPPPLTYSIWGALETGEGTFPIFNDTGRTWTILAVRASVGTAPVGSSVIVDVNKNGTSIFGDQLERPAIAPGNNTSKSTGMTVTTVDDGEYLTVDIDQIGSTQSGSDLVVQITVV